MAYTYQGIGAYGQVGFSSLLSKNPRELEGIMLDGAGSLDEESIQILLVVNDCLVGESRPRPCEVVGGGNLVLKEASEGLIDVDFVEVIPKFCAIERDLSVVRVRILWQEHRCLSATSKKFQLYVLNQLLDRDRALLLLTPRSPPVEPFFRLLAWVSGGLILRSPFFRSLTPGPGRWLTC